MRFHFVCSSCFCSGPRTCRKSPGGNEQIYRSGFVQLHQLPWQRKPRADSRIFQNEYSIWVVKDKHAKSYEALTSPVGERIGRILGIGKSEQSAKCLACHALDVPANSRAKHSNSMKASPARVATALLRHGWGRIPHRAGRTTNPWRRECMTPGTLCGAPRNA